MYYFSTVTSFQKSPSAEGEKS